jgi:hypothetical protein
MIRAPALRVLVMVFICLGSVLGLDVSTEPEWLVVARGRLGDSLRVYKSTERMWVSETKLTSRILGVAASLDGKNAIVTTSTGVFLWSVSSGALQSMDGLGGVGMTRCLPAPDGGLVGVCQISDHGLTALVRRRPDGRGLHRLSMDIFGADDPTLLDDGRMVYTRWMKQGEAVSGSLVALNLDGTLATGLVGGPMPGVLRQARGIPGDYRLVAVASSDPKAVWGWIVLCDPTADRVFPEAVKIIAPQNGRCDNPQWARTGPLYSNPWALSANDIYASYRNSLDDKSSIIHIHDGQQDVLWSDPEVDLDMPVPMSSPRSTFARIDLVDWRLNHGWIYIQDARRVGYAEQMNVRKVRISVLRPVTDAMGQISGTRRIALGTIPIEIDGSIFAQVPAREPLAFTMLDENENILKDMQSWTTVQRGERVSCLGCHVDQRLAPQRGGAMAFGKQPVELRLPIDLAADPMGDLPWVIAERGRIQNMIIRSYGGQ